MSIENLKVNSFDERRDIIIPGDENATLDVCIRHFIATAREAIEKNGKFTVALAGGSTPKALYEHISATPYVEKINWEKIHFFWGDERSVSPDSEESNYKMAMDAGLKNVPIPKGQIHRMVAENSIEENAKKYDTLLKPYHPLDLVILGMGDDGHTASLFPQTEGLKVEEHLCIANYIPQKNTWRITLTYKAINEANTIVIYVIGAKKKHMLKEIFTEEEQFDRYPIQKVGTKESKALWIVDEAAAAEMIKK